MKYDTTSLTTLIDDARDWLANLPPRSESEFPLVNNSKQMLSEGCEFALAVAHGIDHGHIVVANANLRCLIERQVCTRNLLRPGVGWEHQSMARIQRGIDQAMPNLPLADWEKAKQVLAQIRHWNRPADGGNGISMLKPSAYDWGEYDSEPNERLWFERCSQYVHPTFRGSLEPAYGPHEVNNITQQAYAQLGLLWWFCLLIGEKERPTS